MESENRSAKNVVEVLFANIEDRNIDARNVVVVLSVHMESKDHNVKNVVEVLSVVMGIRSINVKNVALEIICEIMGFLKEAVKLKFQRTIIINFTWLLCSILAIFL
jgi:hypothetical protein